MTAKIDTGAGVGPAPVGTGPGRRAAYAAPGLRWRAASWGPPLVLLALCLGFTAVASKFLTAGNLSTLLDQSAVGVVVAVGLTFVIVQGSIDASVEGVMALCGVAVALLVANTSNANSYGWWAVVVVLLIGAVFGCANGLIYTALRIPSLMATLGTWSIGLGLATLFFPGQQPQLTDNQVLGLALNHWLGLTEAVWVAVFCLVLGFLLQRYTRFGRYSYAIGGGEELAKLSGIRVRKYKVLAFAFAGLMYGVAAVLATSLAGYGDPNVGSGSLFTGVAAVVMGGTLLGGGRGGVLHSTVGVLILAVLANGMVLIGISPYIQGIVQGLLIVLAVVGSTWSLRSRMRVVK